MSEPVKPRRPYRSPRRQEQAAQTRSRILAAARELLVERGYAGTTIASVAERAETAAETVYAVFRTKQALLEQAVRKSVRGEDEAPVLEQPGPQLVAAEQDQREQVRLFATDVSARLERASPLLAVLAEAARSEAALAALAHELQQARRRNLAVFVDVLTANGPLRLERGSATETVWALASPELHALVRTRGDWPPERYVAWLDDSLARLLLAG